jgi:hypothetical protein
MLSAPQSDVGTTTSKTTNVATFQEQLPSLRVVLINSIKTAITNGLLVFNGYMGLSVTLRFAKIAASGRLSKMNLTLLLSEDNLKGRVGWAQSGLFLAGLSGNRLHHLVIEDSHHSCTSQGYTSY